MKKISLKKLASTSLLLVLALEVSHPALASENVSNPSPKIDMANLLAKQRIEVAQLRQQGKSDTEILAIITAAPIAPVAPVAPPPLTKKGSKLVISKLDAAEKAEVINLRKEGKSESEIFAALKKGRDQGQPTR